MIGKRIVAIFACALVTTVTPAVYQYGVEPRFQGAQCDISILNLELESASRDSITFKAFLRVENDAPSTVILSQLSLDVYFYSSNLGRFQLIGNLTTDQEYAIQAGPNAYIQSTGTGERTINPLNPSQRVFGYLTFKQGSGLASGTNEAMSKLIQKGFLNIILKGQARVGPFSFAYEKPNTLSIDFWDSNFVVYDILHYNPLIKSQYDDASVVVHAKMRNPSGIPIKIEDYTIDLYDTDENLRAAGINSKVVMEESKDPDTDKAFITVNEWLGLNSTIFLSSDEDTWEDIFFGFNFTDPEVPDLNNPFGKTRENLNWFFTKLMAENSISGAIFRGSLTMVLGGYDEKGNIEGIRLTMSEASEPFTLYDVNLHQQHYADYDGESPVSILNAMDIGEIQTDKVTINTETKDIRLDYEVNTNITNPYRFDFNISNFVTDFVRINATIPYQESEHYSFANGEYVAKIPIGRATRTAGDVTIVPTVTQLTLDVSTTYNTDDFIENSGVGKVLTDLDVDPQAMNLTNPFWLMGPEGKDINPLEVIQYLIEREVDPIAILEHVNNTKVFYTGMEAYYPLQCMHFGNNMSRDISGGVDDQAPAFSDMPYIDRYGTIGDGEKFRLVKNGYYAVPDYLDPSTDDWDNYSYNDADYAANESLYINQYDFAARYDPGSDYGWSNFPHDNDVDSDGADGTFRGAILEHRTRSGDIDNTDGLIWRIYQGHNTGILTGDWGYMYDWEFDGDRNYFVGFNLTAGEQVMFSQNFTLDTTILDNETVEITNATLSVSYRYINAGDDGGAIGLGWFNGSAYKYGTREGEYLFNTIAGPRQGWHMTNPLSDDWIHRGIDVTAEIAEKLLNYSTTGNENFLKGEISFAAFPPVVTPCLLYVDDIVLSIEYEQRVDSTEGLDLKDLFKYTEEADPADGSMYNILEDTEFDGTKFFNFLGDDHGDGAGGGGIDYTKFMQLSNTSLSLQTQLLSEDFTSIGATEPSNFLEMLTRSKYVIPEGGGSTYIPGLGWRDLNDEYWVIEDPYQASRTVAQTLYDKVFKHGGSGEGSAAGLIGEELWYMFENLEAYLPWVMMYLITHGWSKDDIFDVLEACGFASEVHTEWDDFVGSQQIGKLYVNLSLSGELQTSILGIDIDITDSVMNITFDMGEHIMLKGYHRLYDLLCGTDLDHDFDGKLPNAGAEINSRPIVWSGGDISTADYSEYRGAWDTMGELWIFPPFPVHIDLTLKLYPKDFFLRMGVGGLSGSTLISDSSGLPIDTYIQWSGNGLNDVGTRQLATLVRSNLKFAQSTFVQTGGDPVSLFQFLDNYFFGTKNGVDYSSYTLLEAFNCKSTDFIDIITGYNRTAGEFDWNGNGLADDWTAPSWYTDSGRPSLGAYAVVPWHGNNSWGTHYYDHRLWAGTEIPSEGKINGSIIWTDSPDLLNLTEEIPIYRSISGGAPPIVDLFDMLAWISMATGKPDAADFMRWFLGELPDTYYDIIGSSGGKVSSADYNFTLTNQETFRMFQECGFNTTGYISWLEDTKGINPFTLLQEIYEREGILDPYDLLLYSANPNYIRYSDGSVSFVYHEALGSTSGIAQENFWKVLNGSWWNHSKGYYDLWKNPQGQPKQTLPYRFYEDIAEGGINAFTMLEELGVDPASWINLIQWNYGVEPFNILRYVPAINDLMSLNQTKNKKTRVKINGTLRISFLGINLYEGAIAGQQNEVEYEMLARDLYGNVQFADFIDAERLIKEKFVIL